jgi:Fe-S-cluster containining protein
MNDSNHEHDSTDTDSAPHANKAADTDEFDCLACGRCCYQREGTILVTEADLLKWHRLRRFDILDGIEPGHFGQEAFQMSALGACIHHGVPGSLHACAIYPIRAEVCRSFEAGSPQCLEYRRGLQK